MYTTLKYFI